MSWIRNINLFKKPLVDPEDKFCYQLTAEISSDIPLRYGTNDICNRIMGEVVTHFTRKIIDEMSAKFIEDLTSKIDVDTIRENALQGFKDDIRRRFGSGSRFEY